MTSITQHDDIYRARHYALGILVVVYTFNFIDRQILSILLQPVKDDLGLSDTAMGMLTGFAFAAFYATLGIPIARFADRSNRRNLVAWALGIWSLMTALSGLAQNFWHLLAARIGVGIGEAGCSPPAHSMIADYYPADQRATALGIYSLGIPFGIMFGLFAGGWINEFFGWRAAFFVVGLPGIYSRSSCDLHYANRRAAWQRAAPTAPINPVSAKRSNISGPRNPFDTCPLPLR